jgi:hypothetical protein
MVLAFIMQGVAAWITAKRLEAVWLAGAADLGRSAPIPSGGILSGRPGSSAAWQSFRGCVAAVQVTSLPTLLVPQRHAAQGRRK